MARYLLTLLLLFLALPSVALADDSIEAVAWSPDGASLVCAHWDGSITLRDPKTGEIIRKLPSLGLQLDYVTFADANTVVAWTFDGFLSVTRTDGSPVHRLKAEQDGPLQSSSLSPDGTKMAWLSFRGPRLWQIQPPGPMQRLEMETSRASCMAFSPDGRQVAVSEGPHVVFFDTSSGKRTGKLRKDAVFPVYDLAFTPRGTLLTLDEHSVREWSVPQGAPILELVRQVNFVVPRWLVVPPQGPSLAAGGLIDGEPATRFWPNPAAESTPLEAPGRPLFFLPDGKLVLLQQNTEEAKVEVRAPDNTVSATHTLSLAGEDTNVNLKKPALSPDGTAMALPIGNTLHIISLK